MAERNAPAAVPEDDDRMLAAMIAETEDEIFTEATGKDQDDNDGDKSLEQISDDMADGDTDEIEEGEETSEEDAGAETAPERDERNERFVPSGRLREEADARRAAEAREAELRSRLDILTGRVQELSQQPRQPSQEQPAEPDIFVDPEGWKASQREQIVSQLRREMNEQRVNASMDAAKDEFGAEFQYAYDQLVAGKNDPIVQREAQTILASPNPGRALMKWAEPKLAEYREQKADRLRSELAELYGIDGDDLDRAVSMATKANGRSSNNLPQRPRSSLPSLNSASGGGRRQMNDVYGGGSSEQDIFASAFRDR